MKKKVLSVLLTLAMVLSLLPVTVLATATIEDGAQIKSATIAGQGATIGQPGETNDAKNQVSISHEFPYDTSLNSVEIKLTVDSRATVKTTTDTPSDDASYSGEQQNQEGTVTLTAQDLSSGKAVYVMVTASGDVNKGYYKITATTKEAAADAEISAIKPVSEQFTEKTSSITGGDSYSNIGTVTMDDIPYNADGVDLANAVKLTVSSTASKVEYTTTDPAGNEFSSATSKEDELTAEFTLTLTDAKVTSEKPVNLYVKVTAQNKSTAKYYKIVFKMAEQPAADELTVTVAACSAPKQGTVKLTVTGGSSISKYYWKANDSSQKPTSLKKGSDFSTLKSNYNEISDAGSIASGVEITVADNKYIEVVGLDSSEKVSAWGESSTVTEDNYTAPSTEADLLTLSVNDSSVTTNVGKGSATGTSDGSPKELTATITTDTYKIKGTVSTSASAKYSTTSFADATTNELKSTDSEAITFSEHNTVYIVVTAEDTSTKGYYKLTVSKKELATPSITASPSSLTVGAEGPTIELTAGGDGVSFAGEISKESFTVTTDGTGLTYTNATKKSDKVELTFTGTATAGTLKIKGVAAAFTGGNGKESAEITVEIKAESTSSSGTGSSSSGSSTPSTSVTNPSTSGASTTVDVNTNSTTTGSTAKATVTDTNMNKAVNSAVDEAKKQGTAPVVEVEVKTSASADSLNVTLPAASLEKLAEAEDASLVITSDIAEVALDNTALTALADQASGSTVTLEVAPVADSALNAAQQESAGEAPVVDLSLVSNGVVIHDYDGGTITVSLPYKLATGKDPASVQVFFLDDDGSLTPCATSYDSKAAKVTFTTVHLSKYVIGDQSMLQPDAPDAPTGFVDVAESDYFADAVKWAVENSITSGTTATTFGPNAACTRAQIMTFLWAAKGRPEAAAGTDFADVASDAYYSQAVAWAVENGITSGTSETTFGPELTCTRAQAMTFLWIAAGRPAASGSASFTDVAADAYYAGAVAWAVENGITSGTSATTFGSDDFCTRGQIVTFLYKALAE